MADTSNFTSGISGRYATAVFELARDQGSIDTLEGDLGQVEDALNDSADLRSLIASPVYSREEQGAAMAALADQMGLSSLMKNTIGLMAAKRRLFVLPGFLASVRGLIADHRGEISAEVTAAKPLSDGQTDALSQSLKAAFGKDVVIETKVDASLIGGLVVKVGSKMIDNSIRAKLQNLQNAMKEVG